MSKSKASQPELLTDTPAEIKDGQPGDPKAEKLELIDDTPDVVKMDLRKFNKAKQKVNAAVANIKAITIINSKEGVDKMMLVLKEGDAVGKLIEAKRKDLGDPYRLEVVRVNACAAEIVKDLPAAIAAGKALILAFHKAEETRIKNERTKARDMEMELSGFKYWPEGNESILVAHYWERDVEIAIYRRDLEDVSDQVWEEMMQRLLDARIKLGEKQIAALEKQAEGTDFFGDEQGTEVIKEKISEVKTAPGRPVSFGGGGSYSAPETKGLTKRWVFEITNATLVPREFLQVDEKKVKEAVAAGTRTIAGIRIYQDESISLR